MDLRHLVRYDVMPHAASDAINYWYRNERACLGQNRAGQDFMPIKMHLRGAKVTPRIKN
jgi:hypothetical protein